MQPLGTGQPAEVKPVCGKHCTTRTELMGIFACNVTHTHTPHCSLWFPWKPFIDSWEQQSAQKHSAAQRQENDAPEPHSAHLQLQGCRRCVWRSQRCAFHHTTACGCRSPSDSIFSLRVLHGVWPDLVVEHFITACVTISRLLYKSSSFIPNSLSFPVRRWRHDAAHFLLLNYWPARSYSMANARCGIFYEVVCIIGLVGKHLGLTFSLYWLVTYSPPTAAGIITLRRAVTWHFVVSPDRRAENEKGDTYWNNLLQFTNKASEGHLDPGWIWLPLKECCPRGSSAKLTQLSSSSSSALVKCTPLLFSVLLDPWEEVRPWI